VHAVGPAVHVVDLGQIPLGERGVLGLPLLDQPADDRRRQPRGRPEELGQRRHEVARRQPVQIQQRQDLGDLRRPADPARQDRARKSCPRTRHRVDALVVDSGPGDLDRAGTHRQRPRRRVAVADDQPPAVLVDLVGVGGQVGVDLGLQRLREHPPGTLTRQLVQVQTQLGSGLGIGDYTQHAASLPRRRAHAGDSSCDDGWKVRRVLMLGSIHKIQV
jgi:hypothetical protein